MDPLIVSALIAAGAMFLQQWLSGRKTRQGVKAVHDEVRTNHGKRAGEYLENVDVLIELLADHTEQDGRNFERLRAETAAIAARLSDETARIAAELEKRR